MKLIVCKCGDDTSLDSCVIFSEHGMKRKEAEQLAEDAGISAATQTGIIEFELPDDITFDDLGLYAHQAYTG